MDYLCHFLFHSFNRQILFIFNADFTKQTDESRTASETGLLLGCFTWLGTSSQTMRNLLMLYLGVEPIVRQIMEKLAIFLASSMNRVYFDLKVGERMKKIFGNFTFNLGNISRKSMESQY